MAHDHDQHAATEATPLLASSPVAPVNNGALSSPADGNTTTAVQSTNESSDEDEERRNVGQQQNSRPAGETSTQVQSDLGESMVLKFEIFVVKVPLLSLHGIQFKKVDGGTWQYKNMAQTILNELKL